MIFRYVQKKLNENGTSEQLTSEFSQGELVFGRGGEAHVILPSQRVSLKHATFVWSEAALVVSDLGSLAGVRVNGRRVARSNLTSGDVVELGDVTIAVQISGNEVELVATIPPPSKEAEAEGVARRLAQLSISHYLPSMKVLSLAVALVCIVGTCIYPFAADNMASWNSGPISSSHSFIAADCAKCHAEPFQQVQDKECMSCHSLTEHSTQLASFTKKHPHLEMRCAQCHMEHGGDAGLVLKDKEFCTSCHATMQDLRTDTKILNVADFKTHPQFRVSVKDAAGVVTRVDVDDPKRAIDSTQIKLNHEVHLRSGLRGKDGPVTLTCNACHQLKADFKTFEPISFDKHCRDCHGLGFDEALPDAQVPHGDSEAVYPALFTEYTKYILLHGAAGGTNTPDRPQRLLPGSTVNAAPTPRPMDAALVATSARAAERQLFTRTACFLCHSFQEKPIQEQTDTNSHFVVSKPEIPDVWFAGARFSHGAHEEFSCESCHEKTRESTKTSDLLLPGKKLCQECHADGHQPGYVPSGCVECHSYHDPLGIPDEKKHSIPDYLRSLMR